jgi:hypothetical protein
MKKRSLGVITLFLFLLSFSYLYFSAKQEMYDTITSYESCVAAGFRVLETYPEVCVLPGKRFTNPKQVLVTPQEKNTGGVSTSTSNFYKNLSYFIEGQKIVLHDGVGNFVLIGQHAVATGTVEVTDTIFSYDVNNDGILDAIFLLTVTFKEKESSHPIVASYIAGALSVQSGFVGSNAVYLSNNIATTSLMYKNGELYVKYLTENGTDTTKYFAVTNNFFTEKSH